MNGAVELHKACLKHGVKPIIVAVVLQALRGLAPRAMKTRLLAVVGVYSVKAYAVTRRSREFGIRMALGAGPREILALILTQGAIQPTVAIALGPLLALGAGQVLASLLYHVSAADPLVLGGSAALLALAAMLACLLPARRATRLDPMVVLRSE